jgi:hypothetical protein
MRDTKDLQETAALQPVRKGHIGLIVAGSVITGLIAALGLAVVVFEGAAEPVITGVVLVAFGLGWLMLALLSSRRTSQPQRWALVPAVFFPAGQSQDRQGLAHSSPPAALAHPGTPPSA